MSGKSQDQEPEDPELQKIEKRMRDLEKKKKIVENEKKLKQKEMEIRQEQLEVEQLEAKVSEMDQSNKRHVLARDLQNSSSNAMATAPPVVNTTSPKLDQQNITINQVVTSEIDSSIKDVTKKTQMMVNQTLKSLFTEFEKNKEKQRIQTKNTMKTKILDRI